MTGAVHIQSPFISILDDQFISHHHICVITVHIHIRCVPYTLCSTNIDPGKLVLEDYFQLTDGEFQGLC